jgi:hypothetical protein
MGKGKKKAYTVWKGRNKLPTCADIPKKSIRKFPLKSEFSRSQGIR